MPEIIFDLNKIKQKAEALSLIAHRHQIQLLIAVKAAPAQELLETVQDFIQGYDISNAQEFVLTRGLGFHFITNCPVQDLAFVERINKAQFLISCHSVFYHQEIRQKKLPYVLRLQSTDLITEKSNFTSRFGLSRQDVLALKDQLQNDSHFLGFHFHHGSDKNTVGTYKSAIYGIKHLLLELGTEKDLSINLGGGFINLTLNGIETVLNYARRELPQHRIYIEPGRYFTEGAGSCICQVIDIQEVGKKLSANLNVSRECHLKWSYIERIQLEKPTVEKNKREAKSITFYGNTCYENDIIGTGHDSDLCQVSVGDSVVLSNVSGYSLAWNHSFNGIAQIPIKFLHC